MATAFTLNTKESITYAPQNLKKDLTIMLKDIDGNAFFADSNWNKKSQWQIKTSSANVDKIRKNWGGGEYLQSKSYTVFASDDFKIKFIISKKTSVGGKAVGDAKTTRMQELGSAWIMRRAIRDDYNYKDWKSIRKDPKYPELVEIYPDVDEEPEWLQTFYAQQAKMLEEFSNPKFKEFNREGGFMDFITELAKTKFGISKKDTWNPADIWLIKDTDKAIAKIKKNVEGSKASQTITELNDVLRQMFKAREVVGISLKKISGKTAKYEEYNVKDEDLNKNYNYKISQSVIDLSYKKTFGTQDARVIVEGEGSTYNFQIKGNDTAKISNLKWEPTAKGASAARVGKAPVDMVAALMKDNNMKFINDNKRFPQNANEFKKNEKKYVTMYNAVSKNVDTKIKSSTEFVKNIILGYNTLPQIALSKLMQLEFLFELFKLKSKQRDEFMTDLVFLAAKKGKTFGPFGKLY